VAEHSPPEQVTGRTASTAWHERVSHRKPRLRSYRVCYTSPSGWPGDGTFVALAARYQTDTILTLDRRDFRTVRPLTGHPAFRLLPDYR